MVRFISYIDNIRMRSRCTYSDFACFPPFWVSFLHSPHPLLPPSPTRRCPTNRFILLKIDFLPPPKFLDRNHYYSFLSSLSSLSPLPIRPFFSRYNPRRRTWQVSPTRARRLSGGATTKGHVMKISPPHSDFESNLFRKMATKI